MQLVDCGDPLVLPADTDGFIEIYNNSVTPGSSVMYVYHCDNGVAHMRARCAEDGMWTTNPAELMCIGTVEGGWPCGVIKMESLELPMN